MNIKKYQITITEDFVYNVLRLKGIADCVRRSNVGGWQSERCNRKSFPWAQTVVDEVQEKTKLDGELTYWYNINTGDNYNEWHDHDRGEEDATCGVLYLQTPPNCGAIEFKTKNEREIIYPYPGLLVVFPDDLMHRVLPNEGDGDRVSMAFNFWRMLK